MVDIYSNNVGKSIWALKYAYQLDTYLRETSKWEPKESAKFILNTEFNSYLSSRHLHILYVYSTLLMCTHTYLILEYEVLEIAVHTSTYVYHILYVINVCVKWLQSRKY